MLFCLESNSYGRDGLCFSCFREGNPPHIVNFFEESDLKIKRNLFVYDDDPEHFFVI